MKLCTDSLRRWIEHNPQWRVPCLMISERTLTVQIWSMTENISDEKSFAVITLLTTRGDELKNIFDRGYLLDGTWENRYRTNTNHDREQNIRIKLRTDNIVLDALRIWIAQNRHRRVTCLRIPERTLCRTITHHDKEQIIWIKLPTDNIVFDALRRWIENNRQWR